jgi:Fur family ferric uptake transcriptional regulator
MSSYQTEQKRVLLDFLTRHCDTPFTIEELVRQMELEEAQEAEPEAAPGKSTVYRLMTRLVEEGTVKRFVQGNSRHFCYQIVGGEHCRHHFHLKCTKCGKLIHMNEESSEKILQQVLMGSDFEVNQEETTFFGCCKDCCQKKK